jgi:hypothetical protein
MNSGQVYAKTPIGDEAVRQSTRVVQRNLRMVLVQVDGKLTVGELAAKIGNVRLVENAIEELERGGYIVPLAQLSAAWELGQPRTRKEQVSAISQFSTFGPGSVSGPVSQGAHSQSSRFSSFGKPVLPAAASVPQTQPVFEPERFDEEIALPRGRLKLAAWIAVAALLILGLVIALFPYNNYRVDIEHGLTDMLGTPVTVRDVSLKLLPSPRFSLSGVALGDTDDGAIESIEIHQPWGLALSGAAGLQEITVNGATVPVRRLLALPGIGNASDFPFPAVRQITLRDLRVNSGASIFFGPFQGRLLFSAGKLESAELEMADRSMLLSARPLATGIDLSLDGRAWRVPGIPVNFPSFQAKALLRDGSLQISEIDASYLGGLLKGSWTLNWDARLSMSGSGEMTRLDMRRLSSDLLTQMAAEGDLGGNIRIDGRGDDWQGLWKSAAAELTIDVTRGLLSGIDIGEAARRGAGAVVRAGTTRFDRLQADVGVAAQGVSLRNIRLDAGLMTASGQVQISPEGEVNGGLVVLARSSVSTTRVPQVVSGTLPTLTLTSGR